MLDACGFMVAMELAHLCSLLATLSAQVNTQVAALNPASSGQLMLP